MQTTPKESSSLATLLRLWLGFRAPVDRRAYLWSGLVLLILKYLGDLWILALRGWEGWAPLEYLSPFWTHRIPGYQDARLIGLMIAWSLPFLWIGASMTARRARSAGISPWITLLFFIPGINLLLILVLCLARPLASDESAFRDKYERPEHFALPLAAAVAGMLSGGSILAMAFLVLESPYGRGLFVVAPFAIGLMSALFFNRPAAREARTTQKVVQLALAVSAGSLLLFGIEGALCLAMAYPLAAPLAALGGLLGRTLAQPRRLSTSHLVLLLVVTPLITALDRFEPEPPLREILTTLEVDAPPERVWPKVVAFAELPPPSALIFRLGIAYPMRARIVGQGVGAVRYCEFSTGAFVEPITRWEEPYRLSFDVVAQPPTMHEWSPYEIHPPHLTESLRSERGEFRLVRLAGGGTRLEGRTWYRHGLFPQLYWNLWSDALIHRIHQRVLAYVASRSEADARALGDPLSE